MGCGTALRISGMIKDRIVSVRSVEVMVAERVNINDVQQDRGSYPLFGSLLTEPKSAKSRIVR